MHKGRGISLFLPPLTLVQQYIARFLRDVNCCWEVVRPSIILSVSLQYTPPPVASDYSVQKQPRVR